MTSDLWTMLFQQSWALALLRGGMTTVLVGVLGMAFGLVVASPMAVARWQGVRLLSPLIDVYSILVRSVPGLLVIYLLFFGSVQSFERVASAFGFQPTRDVYPFFIGLVSIAAISCAYSIEVLRGALETIPKGLIEAAQALAVPKHVAFFKIIVPLALRAAAGGLNNVWQMTIKDTSLVSVVGLQEVMRVAAVASGITRSPLVFYVLAALLYFAITGVSQWLFARLERRLERGFGAR
ncbi:ABC transporter permease [Ancylobacter pratisalsi]|uniref:ABC transporter permease subunit n=1 Tax=Ancylobacter pratisalsi TaxID=1745854 RepID=A0A6P1YMX4_9HYPH|nr:ABC transporter permease subunit [Ancylobacter pratisalsi]QIB33134.1 ABC transporter permease subunit [Ancylobacter pratisalsi]